MFKPIAISKLQLSEANVRKSHTERDIDQLADDIFAHGLLQNLVVVPGKRGQFEVTAGGRRLRALKRLVEQSRYTADTEVNCLVRNAKTDNLTEVSLTENFQRQAMSPVDQFRAFKKMADDGMEVEDISKRFGVTVRFIEGRLRLSSLHPTILAALETDEITLDLAKAYASTSNQDRQIAVYERHRDGGYGGTSTIRRAIAETSINGTSTLALFVTEEAYTAAGGRIERDLFTDNSTETWIDPEIAEKLGQAKIEAIGAQVQAETGVGNVITACAQEIWSTSRDLHRVFIPNRALTPEEEIEANGLRETISATQVRLEEDETLSEEQFEMLDAANDALIEQLNALENQPIELDPETKAKMTIIVHLSKDGEAKRDVNYYCVEPLAFQHTVDGGIALAERPNAPVSRGGQIAPKPAPEAEAPDGSSISQRLFDRLAIERRDLLAANLIGDPSLALDYLIFTLVAESKDTGLAIGDHSLNEPSIGAIPASPARESLGTAQQSLNREWQAPTDFEGKFDAFTKLPDADKAAWIAFIVATHLRAKRSYGQDIYTQHNELAHRLDIRSPEQWRPTAENYFGSIKKPAMLNLLEQFGGPELKARYANAKKVELAEALERICAGNALVDPEVKERALLWVPSIMAYRSDLDINDNGLDARDNDEDSLLSDDAFPVNDDADGEMLSADDFPEELSETNAEELVG